MKRKKFDDLAPAGKLKRIQRAVGTDALLPVAKGVYERRKDEIDRAKVAAAEIERDAEPVKARLNRIREEKAQKKAEDDRLRKEHLDAEQPEIEKRVARMIQEQADAKKRAEERERKRKIAEKQFELDREKIAASTQAMNKAKTEAEKRLEAQRQSRVKAVIGEIDRILSDGDPLGAVRLKAVAINPRTTIAERGLMLEALDRLESRTIQHKAKWKA